MRNTYKRTEIHVMTDHQERMQERLDSGDMDLLITNRPVEYERVT